MAPTMPTTRAETEAISSWPAPLAETGLLDLTAGAEVVLAGAAVVLAGAALLLPAELTGAGAGAEAGAGAGAGAGAAGAGAGAAGAGAGAAGAGAGGAGPGVTWIWPSEYCETGAGLAVVLAGALVTDAHGVVLT